MENGYYWYVSSPLDAEHWCAALRSSAPEIYHIVNDEISYADITLPIADAHGVWFGPLSPPQTPSGHPPEWDKVHPMFW